MIGREGVICMLIRDLEYKTGLDRTTIRFYEKEQLITATRKENGYREYTDAHVELLIKIKLLRQLGMSLDTIKELQQGTGNWDYALKEQIEMLESKIHHASKAKEVCIRLREDRADFSTLDAQYYLQLLSQKDFPESQKAFTENVPREVHPWRRYFARTFDYSLITLVISTIMLVVLRIRPLSNWLSILIEYGALLLSIPIQALMLSLWGTTPGKWLFGISVISENGNTMDYSVALDREWQAFTRGYGMGLPVFQLVRLIMSYNFYCDNRLTWDSNTEFCFHKFDWKKKTLIIIVEVLSLCCTLLVAADTMLPKHRGELTVAEFAENYNSYAKTVDKNAISMSPNGNFNYRLGHIIIENGADDSNGDHAFEFEVNNENIQTITYKNTWTNISFVDPITSRCEIAALTAAASQKGMNIIDIWRFENILASADKGSSNSVQYENVTVSWKIVQKGCVYTDNGFFFQIDNGEENDAFVSIVFKITIDNNQKLITGQ